MVTPFFPSTVRTTGHAWLRESAGMKGMVWRCSSPVLVRMVVDISRGLSVRQGRKVLQCLGSYVEHRNFDVILSVTQNHAPPFFQLVSTSYFYYHFFLSLLPKPVLAGTIQIRFIYKQGERCARNVASRIPCHAEIEE